MNLKRIKELIDLMNENELGEMEVEQDGVKIKLVKKTEGVIEKIVSPSAVVPDAGPEKESQDASGAPGNVREVKAPMVGTFYRAPAPDVDPHVEVGDTVQKGDVLCIVEAMKLMNEVKSEFSGRIVEICIENAEPVEFGQTLFLIEPA